MKKIVSFLLAALLLLSLPAAALAAGHPFKDVPANAWYNKAVQWAYDTGAFQGTGAATFSPQEIMTRAQFVQVLANKSSTYRKADWEGFTSFTDVDVKKWYAAPIEWASTAGLVRGAGKGLFEPDREISRQEMAQMLFNYAKVTGNDTSIDTTVLAHYGDAYYISNWAADAMKWAVTHGILKGSDGRLTPTGKAPRCQVAQVFMNADPLLVKTAVEISPPEDPNGKKYADMKELAEAPETKAAMQTVIDMLAERGIRMEVRGEGNKLYYDYSYLEETATEDLAKVLQEALEADMATYVSLLKDMAAQVKVEQPVLVITYKDRLGNVIYTTELTQ